MIVYLQAPGHDYTHAELVHLVGRSAHIRQLSGKTRPGNLDLSLRSHLTTDVQVRHYDWALGRRSLPPATYIFTDRERMDDWQLRVYSALFRHINTLGPGYRAINDPAKMCDRVALLRRLYRQNLNAFNVYRPDELTDHVRYPVFVRRAFDHAQPISGLIRSRAELDQMLEGLWAGGEPESGIIVTEFHGEPVNAETGLFRKLSAYRVGDAVFFFNTGHEKNWAVKYGELGAGRDEHYAEERHFIETDAFCDFLREVFEIAGIEYGRVDFGLVDGTPVVYEINTNPHLSLKEAEHPSAIRLENMRLGRIKYLAALSALDRQRKGQKKASTARFSHSYLRTLWIRGLGTFYRGIGRP